MCRPVRCFSCKKTTWAGCGLHIESIKMSVPAHQWCVCREEASPPAATVAALATAAVTPIEHLATATATATSQQQLRQSLKDANRRPKTPTRRRQQQPPRPSAFQAGTSKGNVQSAASPRSVSNQQDSARTLADLEILQATGSFPDSQGARRSQQQQGKWGPVAFVVAGGLAMVGSVVSVLAH